MSQQLKSFGRRELASRPPERLNVFPVRKTTPTQIALTLGALSLIVTGFVLFHLALPEMKKAEAERAQAEQRVVSIVNQPVEHLQRTSEAGIFSPGWFDAGARMPDFDNVDIRKTQEFIYDKYSYVTSDVNPTEMFVGRDLEFNAMTKYFYADRTLPKKKLSESEMLAINDLYRIIGRANHTSTMWWAIMAGFLALVVISTAAPLLLEHVRKESAAAGVSS